MILVYRKGGSITNELSTKQWKFSVGHSWVYTIRATLPVLFSWPIFSQLLSSLQLQVPLVYSFDQQCHLDMLPACHLQQAPSLLPHQTGCSQSRLCRSSSCVLWEIVAESSWVYKVKLYSEVKAIHPEIFSHLSTNTNNHNHIHTISLSTRLLRSLWKKLFSKWYFNKTLKLTVILETWSSSK